MLSKAKAEGLYLDDVQAGDAFRSREYRLDTEEILRFAAEYDPQSFHLSDAAACETVFKGLAASGWHTAAITMKLLVESIPFAEGIIGAGGEISWPRPTRPDHVLHVESRITDIRPSRSKPDRGFVTVECLTLNQEGEICQKLITKLLLFRRVK